MYFKNIKNFRKNYKMIAVCQKPVPLLFLTESYHFSQFFFADSSNLLSFDFLQTSVSFLSKRAVIFL